MVDDGSTDDTPAVLGAPRATPRLRVLRVPHGGVAAARNAGIAASAAPFVAFHDSDDLALPGPARRARRVPRVASGHRPRDPERAHAAARGRSARAARSRGSGPRWRVTLAARPIGVAEVFRWNLGQLQGMMLPPPRARRRRAARRLVHASSTISTSCCASRRRIARCSSTCRRSPTAATPAASRATARVVREESIRLADKLVRRASRGARRRSAAARSAGARRGAGRGSPACARATATPRRRAPRSGARGASIPPTCAIGCGRSGSGSVPASDADRLHAPPAHGRRHRGRPAADGRRASRPAATTSTSSARARARCPPGVTARRVPHRARRPARCACCRSRSRRRARWRASRGTSSSASGARRARTSCGSAAGRTAPYLARMEAAGQRPRGARARITAPSSGSSGGMFSPAGHRRVLAVSRLAADEVARDYHVPARAPRGDLQRRRRRALQSRRAAPELGPALRARARASTPTSRCARRSAPASRARASTCCSRSGGARRRRARRSCWSATTSGWRRWQRQAAEPPLAGRVRGHGAAARRRGRPRGGRRGVRAVAPGGVRQRRARGVRRRRAGGDEPARRRRRAARRTARARSWSTIRRTSTRSPAALERALGPERAGARARRRAGSPRRCRGTCTSTASKRCSRRRRVGAEPGAARVRSGSARCAPGSRPGVDPRTAIAPDGDPDRLLTRPDCRIVKLQRKVMVGRVTTPAGPLYVKRYTVHAWRVALGSLGAAVAGAAGVRGGAALAALRLRRAGGRGGRRGPPRRPAAPELLRHPRGRRGA